MGQPEVAILLVNNTQLGGAERRFARVWSGLRRRGVSAALVINRSLRDSLVRAGVLGPDDEPIVVIAEPFGAMVRTLFGEPSARTGLSVRLGFWLSKLDYVLGCGSVGWWLLRHRPRLMHLVLGGAYVAWPSQLLGSAPPAVLSIVCPDLREMVGNGLGEWVYRSSIRKAGLVDALTEPIRDGLVRSGVAFERIRVSSGSFVDTTRFAPVRRKEPWVVFSGRFVEEKNPLLFIEACVLVRSRLQTRLPGLRFFVIGDGPLRSRVEAAVAQEGLSSSVEVGWRDDVEQILGRAQVFLSLQRTDNYPSQALLEAMACECAVVATDVGQTERLVDGRVGLRVDATPTAVAEAVVQLLANPVRTAQMGRQGRRRVMASHSTDAYLDYVESVYAGIAGGSPVTGVARFTPSRLTPHA